MKKHLIYWLLLLIAIGIFPTIAIASGSGNIDGGGGDMGSGSSTNYWSGGWDGVRVTVITNEGGIASSTIDYTNKVVSKKIQHYGKVTKLQYKSGIPLKLHSGTSYSYINPATSIPRIVSGGNYNIEAIKRYFCSEFTLQMISKDTNIGYEELIGGKYKLLLEPIAYFTYQGNKYAMTATEAALYNRLVNGDLRRKLPSLTHKNLPLSMFLDTDDLGITAWKGSTNAHVDDNEIINQLGIGIVWFTEQPPIDEDIEAPDYEYRVNTNVITSITLNTSNRITPDNPATVTFFIGGETYTVKDIVIPANQSQLVWVKWRTPDTPQTVPIRVSISQGSTKQTSFVAKIVDLNENPPPDPTANDKNPNFQLPSVPSFYEKLSSTWSVWYSYWVANLVWEEDLHWVDTSYIDEMGNLISSGYQEDRGQLVDQGDWAYDKNNYSASIVGKMTLSPDDIVPTANGKNMKSGYGVTTNVTSNLTTNAPDTHYTNTQTAITYFPEFQYESYWRILDKSGSGKSSQFHFKVNEYSTYNRKVHFSPIWFPNNTKYKAVTTVLDSWTPAGMLAVTLSDYVEIEGNMFDDWYTSRD